MLPLNEESSTPPTECIELAVDPRRGLYRPPVELARGIQSWCWGKGNWLDCVGGEERNSKLSVDLRGLRCGEDDILFEARAGSWRRVAEA